MRSLTGVQKAALVLARAGGERAAKVLRLMTESEVVVLMAEVARLPQVSHDEQAKVLGEFETAMASMASVRQGGPQVARRLLEDRLGSERAAAVLADVGDQAHHGGPLAFLDQIDPALLAGVLANEHLQVGALVLANVSPVTAARVLEHLEPDQRSDLVGRIGRMRRLAPEAVRVVADVLDRQLSMLITAGGDAIARVGGTQCLVDILNSSERSVEKRVLTGLSEVDSALADEIRDLMFSFEDVARLDDRTLQRVLQHVPPKELAAALKNAGDETRERFLSNVSDRARQDLVEEMELLGPTRLSLVENAQANVAKVARDLEAQGEIVLARAGDELV